MENGTEETKTAPGAEAVQVDHETAGNDADVNKALAAVAEIVKAATATPPSAPATESADADEGAESADVEKGMKFKTYGDMAKAMMKAGGMDEKAMKGAMEKMEKAGFDPNQRFPTAAPLQKGEEAKTTKSEDGDQVVAVSDENPVTITFNETDENGVQVTKAVRMTPARLKQLKGAMDLLKMVIEGIPQGTSPATRTPGGNSFGPSGIKDLTQPSEKPVVKSEQLQDALGSEKILKAIGELGDAVKGVVGRVDAIEKAAPAPSALPSEGNDGAEVPTQKAFWRGVL